MPFFDRFWWLRLCAAVLPAAGLALVCWQLARAFPDIDLSDARSDLVVLAITVGLAIAVLVLLIGTRKARERKRRRLSALSGSLDDIPPSRIVPDPAYAPDVSHAPFTLDWPVGRWSGPVIGRFCVWVSVGGVPVVLIVGVPYVLTDLNQNPLVQVLVLTLVLLVTFVRQDGSAWRTLHHSPRRITADADGIRWEPVLGHARNLRWDDARLLEVDVITDFGGWRDPKAERRRYTLYGRHTVIWWTEPQKVYTRPQAGHARLLDLIASRTGLTPRTFTQDLSGPHPLSTSPQAKRTSAQRPALTDPTVYALAYGGTSALSRVIMGLIGLMLTLGGVAAAMRAAQIIRRMPLPAFIVALTGWVNLYAVGCLLPLGMFGLAMLIGSLRRPKGMLIRADAQGLSVQSFGGISTYPWADIVDVRELRFGARDLYVVRIEGHTAHSLAWPIMISEHERRDPPSGTVPISPRELAELVARRTSRPLAVKPDE